MEGRCQSIITSVSNLGNAHVFWVAQAYAEAPWNLNTFSARGGLHGNVLRHTVADVPGLSRPRLDVGMMFSSAPWHMAPHLLYSASYLHTGAPKKW